MDLWSEIRGRLALRAWRARPVGQITADRPAYRKVGDAMQGWDDNALIEDVSLSAGPESAAIIGVDFVVGGSVVE
jgi:hypothetical protein